MPNLRSVLHLPAVVSQAHAVPHGREALFVLAVREGLQGAVHTAEPRTHPQRGETLRVRDLRQELQAEGVLPGPQEDSHRGHALLVPNVRKELPVQGDPADPQVHPAAAGADDADFCFHFFPFGC